MKAEKLQGYGTKDVSAPEFHNRHSAQGSFLLVGQRSLVEIQAGKCVSLELKALVM